MTLGFKTKWANGEPTYFVEKIWAGFSLDDYLWFNENGCWSTEYYKDNFSVNYDWFKVFMKATPKLHTIREDKPNRWKAGNKIHFVINNRTKNRFQFAPVIPVFSTQKIQIQPTRKGDYVWIYVDGRLLNYDESEKLAINDGFESLKQFCLWFNKPFTGKIIHWTSLKYKNYEQYKTNNF